jgi:hypothetical protein
VANGLADRIGDLSAAIVRVREMAQIAEPLPIERFPAGGGLAARLGLGGVQNLAAWAALPPMIRVLVQQAQHQHLHMMAWSTTLVVE